ncbi:MAG: aminotransferase class V-fold PLP-dependent enzyme [Ectothiorhodospiraceae bacterium]|nr:aminotransferase class V-fold PLP-dependent enzyme [Ectothiorhodospiraceae bacterium]
MNIKTPKTSSLSEEFSLVDDILYLNHAAVAPWPNRVVDAIEKFSRENAAQGSKYYPRWVETETHLRQQIQQLINAGSPNDIALLKNTSEALSVVAFGLDWKAGDNVVSVAGEFPSNRVVWEALAPKGVELRKTDIQCNDPEQALFDQVDAKTRLIAISSVQYATGFQLDLVRIGDFCQKNNILFCVDAIQSIGALQFDVQAIQADFVMADGHKWMLGPEGLALFYCRPERREQLTLQQYGWHMTDAFIEFDREDWKPAKTARRFECGSPNMLGIHALNASLSLLLETGMHAVEEHVLANTRYLFECINESTQLELLTDTTPGRISGIAVFRHRNMDNDTLFSLLTENGVMCAQRGGGIRYSPHYYTPRETIKRAVEMADIAV